MLLCAFNNKGARRRRRRRRRRRDDFGQGRRRRRRRFDESGGKEEEEKSEKQLARAREKERKKREKMEKERLKKERAMEAAQQQRGGVVVKTSQTPPVDLDAVSGTRDFFPEDYRLQSWLFSKFRSCGYQSGFEEYDAPVLERQELYKRKAGEEITQQMYSFVDKDDVEVTLRPEMTPTLARMVLSRERVDDIAFEMVFDTAVLEV